MKKEKILEIIKEHPYVKKSLSTSEEWYEGFETEDQFLYTKEDVHQEMLHVRDLKERGSPEEQFEDIIMDCIEHYEEKFDFKLNDMTLDVVIEEVKEEFNAKELSQEDIDLKAFDKLKNNIRERIKALKEQYA